MNGMIFDFNVEIFNEINQEITLQIRSAARATSTFSIFRIVLSSFHLNCQVLFPLLFCFLNLCLSLWWLYKFQQLIWAVIVQLVTGWSIKFLINAEALEYWIGSHSPNRHEHSSNDECNTTNYLKNITKSLVKFTSNGAKILVSTRS